MHEMFMSRTLLPLVRTLVRRRKFVSVVTAIVFAAIFVLPTALAQGAPLAEFPSFIPFDYGNAEFPEGVAVDKVGNIYVALRDSPSYAPIPGTTDQIWKFTPSGERSVFVDFGGNGGGAIGLAVDAEGNVYSAHSLAPKGVFRVDREGNIALLPGTDQIVFPDALAFDKRGNLYVTEFFSFDNPGNCPPFGQGGIWVVPKGGKAKLWLRDDLLTGNCGNLFGAPPGGANGIAYYHGDLYVNSSDKGIVVRVPVLQDGNHGQPEVWATLQEVARPPIPDLFPLGGGDGLTIDVHGNVYVAMPGRAAIVRINAADKSQETIAALTPELALSENVQFAYLDYPASLAFGTGEGGRMSLFVTNLGWTRMFANNFPFPIQWPGPGIVKIEADDPGLPLP
jgi:sugar lactone lactonase YvrE